MKMNCYMELFKLEKDEIWVVFKRMRIIWYIKQNESVKP